MKQIERAFSQQSVTRYTNFHSSRMSYLESQFDMTSSFFLNTFENHKTMIAIKVAGITVVSAGMGVFMQLFLSSQEYNSASVTDLSRSHSSQTRQAFFGYWRMMKKQALHWSRFGLYIGLIDIPIEIVIGRMNFMTTGFSVGMAAFLQNIKAPFAPTFWGSAGFVGLISLYMNKGND